VRGVTLADGRRIECRLVIFASGIRPRDELAASAGLRRAERGGISVDDRCRTGIPNTWAIGECAALNGRTYGLIGPGYRMAESVAGQLTGADPAPLVNVETSTRLKVLGIDVASFGEPNTGLPDTLEFAQINNETGSYAKLVLSRDGRILHGGVLVGDMRAYPALSNLIGKELPAPWTGMQAQIRDGLTIPS
jgi:nitrite reductase (NADH) large subunit